MVSSRRKIVSLKALLPRIRALSRRGKRIAFTNGCFDIIHFGHVSYLEAAKRENRVLIVGLNSDASIRSIKGPNRPINSQARRAAVLAALECVDYVVIFNEDTPYELISAIKPDVLIKGADWKGKEVVGADIVRKNKGRVEFIRYVAKASTTDIINLVLKKCRK